MNKLSSKAAAVAWRVMMHLQNRPLPQVDYIRFTDYHWPVPALLFKYSERVSCMHWGSVLCHTATAVMTTTVWCSDWLEKTQNGFRSEGRIFEMEDCLLHVICSPPSPLPSTHIRNNLSSFLCIFLLHDICGLKSNKHWHYVWRGRFNIFQVPPNVGLLWSHVAHCSHLSFIYTPQNTDVFSQHMLSSSEHINICSLRVDRLHHCTVVMGSFWSKTLLLRCDVCFYAEIIRQLHCTFSNCTIKQCDTMQSLSWELQGWTAVFLKTDFSWFWKKIQYIEGIQSSYVSKWYRILHFGQPSFWGFFQTWKHEMFPICASPTFKYYSQKYR